MIQQLYRCIKPISATLLTHIVASDTALHLFVPYLQLLLSTYIPSSTSTKFSLNLTASSASKEVKPSVKNKTYKTISPSPRTTTHKVFESANFSP